MARDGVEEMETEKLVRSAGKHSKVRHREGRGVRGKDRLRTADTIEILKEITFDLSVLDDGLDDKVCI